MDPEVVERRLRRLLEAVEVLKDYQRLSVEELAATPQVYWAVQHGLQICIQAVLDIATHLVAASGARIGDNYRSYIVALGALGVVPNEFAQRLAAMAGFRNILVHEYLDVDLGEVHRVLTQNLGDFQEFARYILEYLSKSNAET